MARIGIYGGTFNPIHNGHLYIAEAARQQLDLSEVWWVVSGNPPHKEDGILSRLIRYDMCRKALIGRDGMVAKDFELLRAGQCYTYALLEDLKRTYPVHEFFFIMGEDSLEQFSEWMHPNRIAAAASLVVAVRNDSKKKDSIEKTAEKIREKYNANVRLLNTREMPVSSTELRKMAAKGKKLAQVPKEVEAYIREHGLYQSSKVDEIDIAKLQDKLESRLKPGRYRHTIGVMETAANLAMRYFMPIDKLRIAGLLHDCAKCYDNKELLWRCKKYDLPVTKAEKRSPHLLHAKVGAYLAKNEYGCKDPDILEAIRVHTTGAPAMDLVAQILFVADYIEPNRNRAKRLEEIRQMAFFDLDFCTLMILEDTIEYLKEKGDPMDEATVDTWKYYEARVKRSKL